MKLYCVRHGQAESAGVNPDRPLTKEGRDEVERVARYLKKHGLKCSHILHSTKLRTKETAEIFAKVLLHGQLTECQSILDEDANVEMLMDQIPSWTENTLIVGHLPFMLRLISGLVIGDTTLYPIVNYPPAGIVCLEKFNQTRWVIQWILNPELLL